jgi:hypothetical protein
MINYNFMEKPMQKEIITDTAKSSDANGITLEPLVIPQKCTRKLVDRIETYENETRGFCVCGQEVIRVNGSDATSRSDRIRYRYPTDQTTAWNIFRCKQCHESIDDTFLSV